MSNEIAVIETSLGNIEFEFLEDLAPGHIKNFKDLANSDFYNGTTFHRVIRKVMIAHHMAQGVQAIPSKQSLVMNLTQEGSCLWRVRRIQIAPGHNFL